MYVLVEFDGEGIGELAIVRGRWLTPRKKEVYWPPVKQQSVFDKLLLDNRSPDTKNWKTYSVRRCLYETGTFLIPNFYPI